MLTDRLWRMHLDIISGYVFEIVGTHSKLIVWSHLLGVPAWVFVCELDARACICTMDVSLLFPPDIQLQASIWKWGLVRIVAKMHRPS